MRVELSLKLGCFCVLTACIQGYDVPDSLDVSKLVTSEQKRKLEVKDDTPNFFLCTWHVLAVSRV